MPTYTVRSGDMVANIQTPHPANAFFLACLAVHENKPERLGTIIHVTGGQFVAKTNDDVVIGSEFVARTVGLLPERMSPTWSHEP
jgi:hypothetical protein